MRRGTRSPAEEGSKEGQNASRQSAEARSHGTRLKRAPVTGIGLVNARLCQATPGERRNAWKARLFRFVDGWHCAAPRPAVRTCHVLSFCYDEAHGLPLPILKFRPALRIRPDGGSGSFACSAGDVARSTAFSKLMASPPCKPNQCRSVFWDVLRHRHTFARARDRGTRRAGRNQGKGLLASRQPALFRRQTFLVTVIFNVAAQNRLAAVMMKTGAKRRGQGAVTHYLSVVWTAWNHGARSRSRCRGVRGRVSSWPLSKNVE